MSEYHVQYVDRNVSVRDYDQYERDFLLVTKVFYTIQGEGPMAGTPAVFVRLAGCNRGDKATGCEFCDTDFRFGKGLVYRIPDLIKRIEDTFWADGGLEYHRKGLLVVITGGEPMIQNNTTRFCEALVSANFAVQIESNGDRLADGFNNDPYCGAVTLVVSPKIVVSKKAYNSLAFDVSRRVDYLKFVVDARPSSPYHHLPSYAKEFEARHNCHHIYISPVTVYKGVVPEGTPASMWNSTYVDHHLTRLNHNYAALMSKKTGYKLSLQQHLYLEVE